MFSSLFQTIFFRPVYNLLIGLSVILPGHNLALAIILVTLLVRLILLPWQHRMTRTQLKLRDLAPTISDIRQRHAKDQKVQAEKLLALYRQHGINPLTSFALLLVQLPLLLALFFVFRDSFNLQPDLLYGFVEAPTALNLSLFGLGDVSQHSFLLALLVGVTQWLQAFLTAEAPALSADRPTENSFANQMRRQMLYFLPVLVVVFSYQLPAAVPLYWLTSNLFGIAHLLIIRRGQKIKTS